MDKKERFTTVDEADDIDLGACCACRKSGPTVRNIMMLGKRAPVPGTGWGCLVCHLPSDGAIAVVCDACLEAERPILDVCVGYASRNERVSSETVTELFEHQLALHAGEGVWPPDDDIPWPDDDGLCYCSGDEFGHDPDPLGVFHVNEQVLSRARKERGE